MYVDPGLYMTAPFNVLMPPSVKRRGIEQTKTLSTKAKGYIAEGLASGRYAGRKDANEPALMAPSPDPQDYSHVSLAFASWSRH